MSKPRMFIEALTIAQIKIGKRIRKDMGDLKSLAESIRKLGMIHPVVLDSNLSLIAGARRIAAAKLAGLDAVPVTVCYSMDDVAKAAMERDENICRKDFTPEEAVRFKQQIENNVGVAKLADDKPLAETSADADAKLAHAKTLAETTRQAVAAVTGLSHGKVEAAEKVIAAAEADPSLAPIVEKMNATGNVAAAVREVRAAQDASDAAAAGEEPEPWAEALAGLEEFAKAVKAARAVARRVLGCEGQEIKAPWMSNFSYLGTVAALTSLLRDIDAYSPCGGTPDKPFTRRAQWAQEALAKGKAQ